MASPTMASPATSSALWDELVITPDPGFQRSDHPTSQITITTLVLTLEMAFLAVSYLLRAYVKLLLNRKILYEDYFVTIGYALYIAYAVMGYTAVKWGIGIHLWDVNYRTMSNFLHLANGMEILYGLSMLFTKLAILCQFRRFFIRDPKRQQLMAWTLNIFIVLHTAFYVIHTIVFIAGCSPREGFWMPWIGARCVDMDAMVMGSACINMISDFAILVLPISSIWKLNASRKQKLGLTGVFAVGVLGCAASIVRTQATYNYITRRDKSYELWCMGIWASVEMTCAILASNSPYIAQIYQTVRNRSMNSRRRDKNHTIMSTQSLHEDATRRPSDDTWMENESTEPDVEKPRAIYLPPRTRSVTLEGRLDLTESENYFESLFNPGPGTHTRRHELERGLVPGTIVAAMRRQEEALEQREGPRLPKTSTLKDEENGWFE